MVIKLHDLLFKPFISEQEIEEAVQKMVDTVARDLGDEMPVFVGILNGHTITTTLPMLMKV